MVRTGRGRRSAVAEAQALERGPPIPRRVRAPRGGGLPPGGFGPAVVPFAAAPPRLLPRLPARRAGGRRHSLCPPRGLFSPWRLRAPRPARRRTPFRGRGTSPRSTITGCTDNRLPPARPLRAPFLAGHAAALRLSLLRRVGVGARLAGAGVRPAAPERALSSREPVLLGRRRRARRTLHRRLLGRTGQCLAHGLLPRGLAQCPLPEPAGRCLLRAARLLRHQLGARGRRRLLAPNPRQPDRARLPL